MRHYGSLEAAESLSMVSSLKIRVANNAMLPHLSLDNQLAPDKHSDAPQRPPGPVIPSDEILNWQKQALSRHRDIIMPVQEKMKGKINI